PGPRTGFATGRYWSPQPNSNDRINATNTKNPLLRKNVIHTPDGDLPTLPKVRREGTLYRVRMARYRPPTAPASHKSKPPPRRMVAQLAQRESPATPGRASD